MRDQRYALVTHEGPDGVARFGKIKPASKGRLMGRSFEAENRRLIRRATAGDTEWGTPRRGSRAVRTPGRSESRTSGFLVSA